MNKQIVIREVMETQNQSVVKTQGEIIIDWECCLCKWQLYFKTMDGKLVENIKRAGNQ